MTYSSYENILFSRITVSIKGLPVQFRSTFFPSQILFTYSWLNAWVQNPHVQKAGCGCYISEFGSKHFRSQEFNTVP